jgi:hypothetical protein
MSRLEAILLILLTSLVASCVQSGRLNRCEYAWEGTQVASTPVPVENVPGFTVVAVRWPNFIFYENSNKSGRVMLIDAVGSIQTKPGTEIRIDISKDASGDILLLWFRIARLKLVEQGISRFDGKGFVAVCREER